MNPASNGVHEFPAGTQRIEPPAMGQTRPMYWSIRRELWENRFVYVAPLLVTALVLFGSFISMATMSHRMKTGVSDPARRYARMLKPLNMAPAPIMFATFLVGMFYSLDALYGERRDRSILFWKSLPVSDGTAVLSKAGIPLVVLPVMAFALSVVTQIVLLVLSTPILLARGLSPVTLWANFHFFQGLVVMFYGLTVHALWFAPIYGWLMLLSAWARRVPILWAVLPLLAVSAVERITFNTRSFMRMLQYRVVGGMHEAFTFQRGSEGHVDRLSQLEPVRFLSAPGLWVGLIFAAACFAAAARLRRNREPI